MRVLLVSHRYPPDRMAGVERYTQTLAAELVRGGETVSIVARRPTPESPLPRMLREWLPDGSSVYRLTGAEASADRFLAHHERLEQLFAAVMAEASPDVVHINHLIDLSPRFIEVAHRHRVAVVLTLHDFYFACPLVHLQKRSGQLCQGPDGGWECATTCFAHEGARAPRRWGLRAVYFRRLLAMAERVISPSQYAASYFERFGVERARLCVIPNGVPIESVEEAELGHSVPRERGPLNVAFLGAVVPYKGAHVIVEALRIAALDSVDFLVLGLVADRAYWRDLCERATTVPGLRLRMYGEYQPAELHYLLRDVDCVVVPSQLPENFPLVTQEALGRGIPIVASRLGGLTDIVAEGENGLTFDHSRPEELAAILRRLAEDESLLRRLREGARMTRVMGMAQHADAVRAVYRAALEDRARSGGPRDSDKAELRFLHAALLEHGFAAPS